MGDTLGLNDLSKKFEDPLFVLALIASIIPALRFFIEPENSTYTVLPLAVAFIGLILIYFTYLSIKKDKNYWVLGVLLLTFGIALFLHYSNTYGGRLGSDYNVFALSSGFLLLFYTLSTFDLLDWKFAIVLAIFSTTLVTHVMPAQAPYLAALDPYWHFKFSEIVVDTGHIPQHDYSVYPLKGGMEKTRVSEEPGLDFKAYPFFNSVSIATTALVLKPLGFTELETAILFPGVVSAFTVVLVYLLVVVLFSDNKPYNHIAAILAAFMIMFSPAFATKSIATNAEDDALGAMLMVGSLFLFIESYRKKSLKISLLSAFSFTVFSMTWGGFIFTVVVLSAFSIIYSLLSFMRKESCIEQIPYLIVSLVPSVFIKPLILHARGSLPQLKYFIPGYFFIVGVGASILFALLLEFIRMRKHGKIHANKNEGLASIHNTIEDKIHVIGIIVLVVFGLLVLYVGVEKVYSFILWQIIYAKSPPYLIGKTIAEQNPLANNLGSFLAAGTNRFGLSLTFGILMILPLAYLAISKKNLGAVFVLCWALPMMYGSYNKSQFIFAASVPISVLGATIGLFAIAKLKDFQSLRVIGMILVLATPMIYVPFFGSWNYGKFVASVPMSMGVSGDRYYWDSGLEWLKTSTPENSAVLTWWDYGHWITSISHRYVLIDNLQADHYQIQDIARFFVNATDEETAFKTVEAYQNAYEKQGVDLRYVVIDWTMIGKGSALHFIATGEIEPFVEGSWKNYAHCTFNPQFSDTNPKIVPSSNGTISYVQDLIFACTNYIPGVKFRVENNRSVSVTVLDGYGGEIPWDSWVARNDASLLGLYEPGQIIGLAKDRPFDNIIPTLRSFVYVPGEFNDFMMTRLYLGDTLEAYKALGLYNRDVEPLKHFKKINDFSYGFVRVYEIIDELQADESEMGFSTLNITST